MRKAAYTVEEVATLLGIGRSSAYAAIHTGEIPSVRIGRRFLVPVAALNRLLDVPAAESMPSAPGSRLRNARRTGGP
jgi:excisionase family DNA binding protein